MAVVSGMLSVGEANATVSNIANRQRGSISSYYLILFGTMAICAVLGAVAWSADRTSGATVGWVAGSVAYLIFARRLTVYRFRAQMKSKGLPLDLPLRMEITQEALIYDLGDIRQIVKWTAVTELFHSRGYWIFLAQSSPLFAPERFFADKSAETQFLKEALQMMSPEAVRNSPEAAVFSTSTG